jgi:hypothetical protein
MAVAYQILYSFKQAQWLYCSVALADDFKSSLATGGRERINRGAQGWMGRCCEYLLFHLTYPG